MAKNYIVDLNEGEKVEMIALTQMKSLLYKAVCLVLKITISNPGNIKNGAFQLLSRQICLVDRRYPGAVH